MLQFEGGEAPGLVPAQPREGDDRPGLPRKLRLDAGDLPREVEGSAWIETFAGGSGDSMADFRGPPPWGA